MCCLKLINCKPLTGNKILIYFMQKKQSDKTKRKEKPSDKDLKTNTTYTDIALGYQFEYDIELPKTYFK